MTAIAAARPGASSSWRKYLVRHETILLAILLIALAGLGALNDKFLTVDNLLNQGRLMTEIGLIALPMTFVIVTGGIDLSVGAIVGLCAIMLGYSWKNLGIPLPFAIPIALTVGGLAGFVNGLIITRLRVPPLIATIATLAFYRGLAEGISKAHSVRGYPDWFFFLGQGDLFGVPAQLWILFLGDHRLRRRCSIAPPLAARLYAIGSNETAARFSALPVDRVKLIAYTLSGLTSGSVGLGAGLARHDDTFGYGVRLRARRDRGRGARRHEHFRRLGHDLGHRDRPRDDSIAEERSGAHRVSKVTPQSW